MGVTSSSQSLLMFLRVCALVFALPLVAYGVGEHGRLSRETLQGRGVEFPLLNVHVQEPADRADRQLQADAARNLRRQGLELEEEVVFSRDFLANLAASSTAQTQELLSAADAAIGGASR